MRLYKYFIIFLLTTFPFLLKSQCFQVNDGNGVASANPYFVSCTGTNFTVFIQTDIAIGPYTINWGDGSANTTGALLTPPAVEQHTYTATTDTFIVTITDNGPNPSCVVTGVVVMERNPLASIQLPAGDDNFGCTPVQFRFVNSSTQISETTFFEWDFGDGSPVQRFDFNNLNDTITHVYQPGIGTQSCNLDVVLTATNYCGSSNNTFSPLRVWDLDDADINASAVLLCYPDTIVQYTNNTTRNCFVEGNNTQRYEKWNFGDHWGLGYDSIIDWRPWNPPIINPPPIGYPGIGFYTVTLIDSSFCGLDTAMLTIQITSPPTSIITSNRDTICEGESVTFNNNSIGGANTYRWNFDQGAGFENLNGNSKTRTYNTSGDYVIQLAVGVAGAQGCNDTSSIALHVLPTPTADFNFDTNNECDSMQVNFTDNSTGTIASYTWTFDNGNTFSGLNPPAQDYSSPGTYNIQLTVSNVQGCTHSVTKSIRVRDTPTAGFTVSSVCLNQLASFNDQSTSPIDPITTYKWFFGDGDSSTLQNPNHLYTAFGVYQVTQIVNNGFCADTAILNVTVENNPTAAFMVDTASGCSRLSVNFTNQSSANAVSYIWNFGDGSPIVTAQDTNHVFSNFGSTDTVYTVQLIAMTAFGCADTVSQTITVFPVPQPTFTSDAILDCGPLTVNFNNTTQGTNLIYTWDFGDGSPKVNTINPTHVFENTTLFISNYNVSLMVESTNGCRDTTVQVITVYPEPQFTFSAQPDSGCSPLRVSFPSVVGAVDYQWDFGDGDSASGPTPMHTFVNNTTNNQTFRVRLIAQNSFGCLDTNYGDVLVYPNPTAQFTLDTNRGCQPLTVNINNTSTGANFFDWDFGDSTFSNTSVAAFQKVYTNQNSLTSFHTLQLITRTIDGCEDTLSRQIQVHPYVEANFSSDSVSCAPFQLRFSNNSVGASTYLWTFGDGDSSTSPSPSHTYLDTIIVNKNYPVHLKVISPQLCEDSFSRNILVYPKPIAQYTPSANSGCQPLEVTFTNGSSLVDSCSWNFGDSSGFNLCSPSLMHTYTNTTSLFPINYRSQLIVFTNNGCRDTAEQNIRVNPQIIAEYSADSAACTPFPVNFREETTGAQNFEWTFGNGRISTNRNPRNTYVNPILRDTIYNAKLKVTSQYGCTDSIIKPIIVYPKPIADYSLDFNTGCHPLQLNFSNNSSIADSCFWNFGDGNTLDSCFNSISRTYTNALSSVPINRTAVLRVFTSNGCSDTINQNIRVNPQIIADFDSDTAGCHPLRIRFNDRSTGAANFQWTFGDGAANINQSPQHSFQNFGLADTVFTTQLKVTSNFGCTDSIQRMITVFPKPIADYSLDTNEGCQPLRVQFNNQSQISDSCVWIYGDGNRISSCLNNIHTYFNTLSIVPINLNAELRVFTVNGCSDTLRRNINVKPQVIADFVSDTLGCSPLNVDFRSQSFGAIDYRWDFGNGRIGSGIVTNNRYTNTGTIDSVYTASLVAQSVFDCSDTTSQNIRVRPTPVPNFTATPVFQVFPNSTVSVQNQSNDGNWTYQWDFDDSTTSILRDPAPHIYSTWGQYNIQLIASSAFCSDSISRLVEIDIPVPVAEFSDSASGCQPLEVRFRNESMYGDQYEWDFGDGRTSNAENPTHIYFDEGTYSVSLRVIGEAPKRKEDQITKLNYIRVYKSPVANFVYSKDEVFVPNDPLVFSNRSADADQYLWSFGDGSVSNEESPTYQYTVPGEYQVVLIASTIDGCSDTAVSPTNVIAQLEGRIQIPNAFTPSPNGPNGGRVNLNPGLGEINDVFYAKVSGTVNYELNIFNKWGELIFISKDINVGWDGYYRGELSKQDVYVWKVRAEFADGTSIVKAGELLLLR